MLGKTCRFRFNRALHTSNAVSFYNDCVVYVFLERSDGRFKAVIREIPADKEGLGMVGTCLVASAAELFPMDSHSSVVVA